MKNTAKKMLLMLLMAAPVWLQSQRLSVGVTGGVNNLTPILDWNSGIVKQESLPDTEDKALIHYGVTGKLQVYERLFLRSDLFYRQTKSNFLASYKVVDDLWTSAAKMERNTFNWMIAPQLHFLPRNLAYIFCGFALEMNSGTKFTYGILDYVNENDEPATRDFKDESAQNRNSSAVIMGLGIHPRFNRVGIFAEIRYSRSRPASVHSFLPQIGQENVAFAGGITFDLIE